MLRPSSFNRLLQRHGKDCTLTIVTEGPYDPALGTAPVSTEALTVRCHPVKYTLENEEVPSVLLGSRRFMVQATDTSGVDIPKPKAGDTLEGFGDKVIVVSTQEVYSLGIVCYFCLTKE